MAEYSCEVVDLQDVSNSSALISSFIFSRLDYCNCRTTCVQCMKVERRQNETMTLTRSMSRVFMMEPLKNTTLVKFRLNSASNSSSGRLLPAHTTQQCLSVDYLTKLKPNNNLTIIFNKGVIRPKLC